MVKILNKTTNSNIKGLDHKSLHREYVFCNGYLAYLRSENKLFNYYVNRFNTIKNEILNRKRI